MSRARARLCGSGSTSGVNTQRSSLDVHGSAEELAQLAPDAAHVAAAPELGARVPTELSHNTRRGLASSRRTWWLDVGSSSQSLEKAMIGVDAPMPETLAVTPEQLFGEHPRPRGTEPEQDPEEDRRQYELEREEQHQGR